uniref:Uncharacterized protein n=1 Tax=Aegilops tauschii subsp. strangulata TaxID=200361 RepID=A0A453BZU9_AEGTS
PLLSLFCIPLRFVAKQTARYRAAALRVCAQAGRRLRCLVVLRAPPPLRPSAIDYSASGADSDDRRRAPPRLPPSRYRLLRVVPLPTSAPDRRLLFPPPLVRRRAKLLVAPLQAQACGCLYAC